MKDMWGASYRMRGGLCCVWLIFGDNGLIFTEKVCAMVEKHYLYGRKPAVREMGRMAHPAFGT
jgi:hypothetical protein